MHLLLKIPRQGGLADLKNKLIFAAAQLGQEKLFRSVKVVFDVDPV
jgi:hypothetical protein